MKALLFLLVLVFICLGAQASEYKNILEKRFRCPICGMVQVYTLAGIHKCPSDGSTMLQVIE